MSEYAEKVVDAVGAALGVDTGTISESLFEAAVKAVEDAGAADLLDALESQRCPDCAEDEPIDVVCNQCRIRRTAIAKAKGGA